MPKRNRALAWIGVPLAIAVSYAAATGQPNSTSPRDDGTKAPDELAIRALAKEFAAAFNKGDAQACAAHWTEQGECTDADGTLIRGRSAIEQAFAGHFKAQPGTRIEVLVGSVRFPTPEVAVEEGLIRQSTSAKALPSTTLYSSIHVRTGGKWLTATTREWGAGHDRLDDLEWLIGGWQGKAGDATVTLTFARDEQKPFIVGRFDRKSANKPAESGSLRIGIDPGNGRVCSWHFEADGGHGQAYWSRDGSRWLLDAAGVLGDGTPTASVNVLGRVGADEITWRSIDRVAGGASLPDTVPLKLTRVVKAR